MSWKSAELSMPFLMRIECFLCTPEFGVEGGLHSKIKLEPSFLRAYECRVLQEQFSRRAHPESSFRRGWS